jgi:hypothetical protein
MPLGTALSLSMAYLRIIGEKGFITFPSEEGDLPGFIMKVF